MAIYFSFPILCTGGLLAVRPSESGSSFSIVFYVAFVVAFIYFTYFVTKTVGMRLSGFGIKSTKGVVKSVDMAVIGADRRVSVIEVMGVHYIVYSDKNGVTLLDKRTDMAEGLQVDSVTSSVAPFPQMPSNLSFKKTFDYILKKNRDEND